MPKRREDDDYWPNGTICPRCGRRLKLHYDLPHYKTASCTIEPGHCGEWFVWESGESTRK